MDIVETAEFSIEANPLFENVRLFAGTIGLSRQAESSFSPQMSIWSSAPKGEQTPQDWLTKQLEGEAELVTRKPVNLAGMAGEIAMLRDSLEDVASGEERDWFRLRALLVSADGTGWFHATAVTSEADRQVIEADFERLLGSIKIKLAGDAIGKDREANAQQTTALWESLKKHMEAKAR